MIDPDHPPLSTVRQCELASISRLSFYREPTAQSEETLRSMRLSAAFTATERRLSCCL